MQLKFNTLLFNPLLDSSSYYPINNVVINNILDADFRLPQIINKAFIFSCFALSTDGRLCYPDLPSGFAIAKHNWLASDMERYADWWNLSLGRAIADAVIIGSNSLRYENGHYQAYVDISELLDLREQLAKPKQLLHIIVCRDSRQINWQHEALYQNQSLPIVIFTQQLPTTIPDGFVVTERYLSCQHRQIIHDADLDIRKLCAELFSAGIKTILNESPYYHHELQHLQLLDEAWLNTSGVQIGGDLASLGRINTPFDSSYHPHLTILTLQHIGYNFLYARYKISYGSN
ncbi:MAG: hypothetical protein EKK57_11925 [Proteobacteria bacterium]|nr:MAG: hypothetical protein EKK57_11925 [Pseudomonadota bacterium]